MLKPGAIFIAFCMTAVVASVATILVVGLGMRLPLALAGGVGGVALIALVNHLASRATTGRQPNVRFFELEERISLIAERVLALEPRILRVDAAAQETARRTAAPLEKEIAELGSLVRMIAETVEQHDRAIADLPARQAAWNISQSGPLPELPRDDEEEMDEEEAFIAQAQAKAPAIDPGKAKQIRRAIESDGIELHLQPVAALPQRRVIQYLAVPYMRDQDVLIPPGEFVLDARLGGLQPALDAFVLDRAMRVARRLKARDRDISLMVSIEAETLMSSNFASDIAKRLDGNADLATHLVIGFSQEAFYGFGNVEAEMLSGFSERGFRFALTGVRDLDLDAASLHQLGIRFLRLGTDFLLDPERTRTSAIHPADLPGLLRRHGILLVADGADTEARVADLLDLDVRAAQGAVFGMPRPVRPEIFTGEEGAPAAKTGARGVPAPAAPPATADRGNPVRPFRSVARRA
ncbi:diguanylate phosphodiesterase [Terrihabitans soli]|uniref:Diguanylate phosphodiesterase n=1 Tax=Terrihabitans soli TaxID=708113 RepID=A0A6S6QUU4_9HYPH|nr:EAL domain-containing protein [Terrihabitans soli]BCJ91687.1 diguanylate phosphodiesterase [Terrihabitans soli]